MIRILFASCILLVSSNLQANSCNKQSFSIPDLNEYYTDTDVLVGEELKEKLNTIIKGHKKYSYTPCVWAILKEADEDPDNNENVIGFYSQRSIPKSKQDNGSNDPNSWNREHIWAKSHGFKKQSQHAYTDAHHLRAADRSINSDRSNNDFANGGESDDECTLCREGDGTWEAPNAQKGDVARMMFYMATRYEGGDNSKTPDLELVDRKTSSGEPLFGKLCTLLSWHLTDPVSAEERKRNDVINTWQGNRNPFIDKPEFATKIWGEECGLDTKNIAAKSLQVPPGAELYDGALTGIPHGINDGDTFKISGQKIRLWGYDSPESKQKCYDKASNTCISCGVKAKEALISIVKDKVVSCFDIGERTYGRVVGNCYVGETNINHQMVIDGWGVATEFYTPAFVGAEAIANAQDKGIWATEFIEPYRWRKGSRLAQCN